MSTKHLKKRDRAWSKGMVTFWRTGAGRDYHSTPFFRDTYARQAHEFLSHRDPFQSEAIALSQYNQPDARVYFGTGRPKIIPGFDKAMYINSITGTPWFWNLDRWSTQP